jgi:hypothetical protein
MSQSAQLISQQLNDIIEEEKKASQGARDVQEQVDGNNYLDTEKTSSVLHNVLNIINNQFEYKCHRALVRLLNDHLICQSIDDRVPGNN